MSQTPSEYTGEVQGVLTGQVPVRSMSIAMQRGLSNDEIARALEAIEAEAEEDAGSV